MQSIAIVEQPLAWTAVVREAVPRERLSTFVPKACGEVWAFVKAAGVPGPGRHVALYTPDGVVEVGVEVAGAFEGSDRVLCSRLPDGCAAHAVHFGPYGELGRTHDAVRKWCQGAGHVCAGTIWEIYGHWEPGWNSDPSKIRTDVYHLLGAS